MHTAYVNSVALKLTLTTTEKELDSEAYASFEKSSASGQLQEMPQVLMGLKSVPMMQLLLMPPEVLLNLHRLFESAKNRDLSADSNQCKI